MIVPAHSQAAAQDLGMLSLFKAEKHGGEREWGLQLVLLDQKSSAQCKETSKRLFLSLFQALDQKEATQGEGPAGEQPIS